MPWTKAQRRLGFEALSNPAVRKKYHLSMQTAWKMAHESTTKKKKTQESKVSK